MSLVFALAGNPNSGKTTLFNELTGSKQYVGNWPGVTVEKKEGVLKEKSEVTITDLPGIYSLSPYTLEEVIARDYLLESDVDLIINLVDGSNIERNLYLTTQLTELGIPVVIALNMMDLVEKQEDEFDIEKFSAELDCPVVPITAVKGEGIEELIKVSIHTAEGKHVPRAARFSTCLEHSISEISLILEAKTEQETLRWSAIKCFERDEKTVSSFDLSAEESLQIEAVIAKTEKEMDDDSESILASERYNLVDQILLNSYVRSSRSSLSAADKIDKLVTSRILGLPIFVGIMFFVYWLATFSNGPGTLLTEWIEDVLLGEIIMGNISAWFSSIGTAPWLNGLIVDGIVGGVGAVLTFLPQMAILFFMLSLLEQSGYMSRIAFLMDRLFRRFGLSGRSFIPILISSGCAVPGIMATRTIESEKDRRMTIILTAFIPCGAKLPVIALIAGAMFGGVWWFAPLIYFTSIAVIIVSGIILKKTRYFSGEATPFVMELPPYHFPQAKSLFRQIWDRLRSFILKAGTVIMISSVIIWLLSNLSFRFAWVSAEESMLASLGKIIAPLFSPLGFGDWRAVVATISGLFAKENLVSSIAVLMPGGGAGSDQELYPLVSQMFANHSVAAFSFLLFNMICAPCIAAIGAVKQEMNSTKWTAFTVLYQTVLAYTLSFMVYQFGIVISDVTAFSAWTVAALSVLLFGMYLIFRPNSYDKSEIMAKDAC